MLLFTAVSLFIIYILITLLLYSGLKKGRYPQNSDEQPVTILIAARNEEQNIGNLLHDLTFQHYSKEKYEVIIINDRSNDRTENIVKGFVNSHDNFFLITLSDTLAGTGPKKYALKCGIEKASHDIILLTDADCRVPPEWIRSMIRYFVNSCGMTAGFAPLLPKDSLISRVVSVDSLVNAFISAGSVGLKKPVTCAARNLAFRKQAFNDAGGYDFHKKAYAGDDDLLVQAINGNTEWDIAFAQDFKKYASSYAPETVKEYFYQKTRHISASRYYRCHYKALFGIFHFSNLVLWLLPLGLFFPVYASRIVPILTGLKIIFDCMILKKISRHFHFEKRLPDLILWDIYFLLSNIFLGPVGLVKKVKWKDN